MAIYLIILLFTIFQISIRSNTVIVTLYAMKLDASPFHLGLIVALSSLFPMILAVYAGKASDKYGYRIPLVVGSIGLFTALLFPFLFRDLTTLFISQSLVGLSQIFVQVSMQNLIGILSSEELRARNFSTLGLGGSLANLLGPLLTGFSIEYLDYESTYLFLSILAIIPAIFFMFLDLPIPTNKMEGNNEIRDTSNYHAVDLLKSRPLRNTFIASGIILTGIGLYNFYIPIYGQSIGLSASIIGIILSVHAAAFFVVRLISPFLIKRYDENRIFTFTFFVSAVAFIVIPFSKDMYLLAMVSFLLGLGLGCGQPISILMTYNHSPEGRTGEALGIRLTVNKVAQFLVPLLFGSLGSIFGLIPVFWANALLFLIGGFFGIEKREVMKKLKGKQEEVMKL